MSEDIRVWAFYTNTKLIYFRVSTLVNQEEEEEEEEEEDYHYKEI